MNKTLGRVLIVLAAGVTSTVTAAAARQDAPPVTVNADASYLTRYLFAGIPFSTGGVLQGAVHVGYNGWTFHAFTNYDLDASQLNEGDIWGDYYHQVSDQVGVYVGAAYYNFKIAGTWQGTPELYGGIVITAPGTPTLYVARDFDLTKGEHAAFSMSHSVQASPEVTVQGTARIEYNRDYYRVGSGFSYADLTLGVPFTVGTGTITPTVILVGGIGDGFSNRVVGGVHASVALR